MRSERNRNEIASWIEAVITILSTQYAVEWPHRKASTWHHRIMFYLRDECGVTVICGDGILWHTQGSVWSDELYAKRPTPDVAASRLARSVVPDLREVSPKA